MNTRTIDESPSFPSYAQRPPAPAPDAAALAAAKELEAFERILSDLQTKHPDAEVEPYHYSGGRLILRTPDEPSFMQFMDNRAKAAQAGKVLAMRCTLYPEPAVIETLFRRKPGLSQRIADKLLEKAGAGEEITLGK